MKTNLEMPIVIGGGTAKRSRRLIGLMVGLICAVAWPLLAQPIVEGGSPLYDFAVRESLAGLRKRANDEAPAQGQVCPSCGKIHPPVAAGSLNDGVHINTPAVSPQAKPCPKCGKIHTAAEWAAYTNHNASVIANQARLQADVNSLYYYCTNCKAYHLRKQPLPAQASPADQKRISPPAPVNAKQPQPNPSP